jgi:hypothetical protein
MESPTTLWDTDLLLELAGRRRSCLEQLHALGGLQLELIETSDTSRLLNVLAAKENVLEELRQVERRLDPFRPQQPEERQWRAPDLRERCAEIFAASERLFRDILEQERRGEERLRQRRDETAARLQGAQLASQARGAYTHSSPRYNRLDVSSER